MKVYDSAGRLIYETDRLRELALDRERKITGVIDERPYPYRWPDADRVREDEEAREYTPTNSTEVCRDG